MSLPLHARAVWLEPDVIALPRTALAGSASHRLHCSLRGDLTLLDGHLHGCAGPCVQLTDAGALPRELTKPYPHLAGHQLLRLPPEATHSVPEMLTGQLILTSEQHGAPVEATGVQTAAVLDYLYAEDARSNRYGAHFRADGIELRLWAPTAQSVALLTWPAESGAAPDVSTAVRHPMLRASDGSWSAVLSADWVNARYLFEVQVFVASTSEVERNLVTDPYSVALTLDSQRSVLVDLGDPRWQPSGWLSSWGPALRQLVDATVYELHVRDFSISDDQVPESLRGGYLAFGREGHGRRHLSMLAAAGLNTVHLLPCFDSTCIPEDPSQRREPGWGLGDLPPDSAEQQMRIALTADVDGFNWGYDPWHWMTPEGSYTSSAARADGGHRLLEFRTMISSLHDIGLRVVLDQVYTGAAGAGQDTTSVLDRIVPGYYHRLDQDGQITRSTVHYNVAAEHAMAEKLMVDSVLHWVRQHHVDGFRFDLMGHSSAANMLAVRTALDNLTVEEDGIDGSQVYLYGEGWNFGEVADNARFQQACQGQTHDSRVATFTDRLRDAIRGGRPMDKLGTRQGFATGLCEQDEPHRPIADIDAATVMIRLGLAGNLRSYRQQVAADRWRRGDHLPYSGQQAGYADEPWDVISYVGAHDNETLWDTLLFKLPAGLSISDRVRMNTLALALVTLSQTPVLWHAGVDLLRSKSLDRNSYNSGDWFNRLDWTGQDNGFARGLPPAADNAARWNRMAPLLANPALRCGIDDVQQARSAALDLLRLRFSSPLFRLGSAHLIRQKVHFPLSGTPLHRPGTILMHLDDTRGEPVDSTRAGLLVGFNAQPASARLLLPTLRGINCRLHQVHLDGADLVVRNTTWDAATGRLDLPGRTVAVLDVLGGPRHG